MIESVVVITTNHPRKMKYTELVILLVSSLSVVVNSKVVTYVHNENACEKSKKFNSKGISVFKMTDKIDKLIINNTNFGHLCNFTDITIVNVSNLGMTSLNINTGFKRAEKLDASYNHLTEMSDLTLLPNITEINYSHNDFINLNLGITSSLHITKLDFSWNNIQSIGNESFSNLFTLQNLDLSHNNITSLNEDLFKNNGRINYLDISNNALINFNFIMFSKSQNLMALDLSYNNLTMVNASPAWILPEFKHLNIEGNAVTTEFLNSILRETFPKMAKMTISKNQVECENFHKLLSKWKAATFIINPSQSQTNIGMHCVHTSTAWSNTDIILKIIVASLSAVTIVLSVIICKKRQLPSSPPVSEVENRNVQPRQQQTCVKYYENENYYEDVEIPRTFELPIYERASHAFSPEELSDVSNQRTSTISTRPHYARICNRNFL